MGRRPLSTCFLDDHRGQNVFGQWLPGSEATTFFVDRFTYHFRKPRRGEVIVFDTSDIERIPESSRGKFYIKRLSDWWRPDYKSSRRT